MIRYLAPHHLKCSSMRKKSSFDVSIVSKNYAVRTEWAASNFGNKGPIFRMVLPPPNVTGKLHLGHALTIIIEDAMCRHHRVKGGAAYWLPGFDHAGIATQSVVEKELWNNRKIQRHQMSREEFTSNCRLFSEKNASLIEEQLKQLGATLNWQESYYTLDHRFSSAVIRAFYQLNSDKLIYRDNRLVNWCPHLQSSISDQEVERVDVSSNSVLVIPDQNGGKRTVRVGVMHRICYPLLNSTKYVEVGTTRPETIFADVALAVNPYDTRYTNLIGKTVLHPIIHGRELPILADEAVVMNKGTGILKITPSHDYLDYEIASRHWDEILRVDPNAKGRHCFDDSGRLNVNNLKDMDRFDGREKVIKILEELNLYRGEMNHDNAQITICSRTGDIIEPRLTQQWFMNTSGIYEDADKAIRDGRIKISPVGQEQKLFDWLSNKDPWCLSRQLLWGHRIPAYKTEGSSWVIARSIEEARERLGTDAVIQQESDVLDTWFSSSLVPLVTSGWMEGTLDASKPLLNIMETGWDISGFWVARMIAITIRLTGGQVPFPRVVLHGLIRDSNGRKMSKSLGNVIDPLDILNGIQQSEMIERLEKSSLNRNEIMSAISDIRLRFPEGIPRSGADALRFALLRHDVLASDIPINITDLASEGLRFCNKLWNLIAYVETVDEKSSSKKEVDSDDPADLWILSRLAACLQQVDSRMAECSPHLAFSVLHTFILNNLCDIYLETTKKAMWEGDSLRISQVRSTLHRVVQPTLVQLSVFMPFISEYLYEKVFARENGAIYFDFVKEMKYIQNFLRIFSKNILLFLSVNVCFRRHFSPSTIIKS